MSVRNENFRILLRRNVGSDDSSMPNANEESL